MNFRLVTSDARKAVQKTLLNGIFQHCGSRTAAVTRVGDWLTSLKPSCPADPDRVEGARTLRGCAM